MGKIYEVKCWDAKSGPPGPDESGGGRRPAECWIFPDQYAATVWLWSKVTRGYEVRVIAVDVPGDV